MAPPSSTEDNHQELANRAAAAVELGDIGAVDTTTTTTATSSKKKSKAPIPAKRHNLEDAAFFSILLVSVAGGGFVLFYLTSSVENDDDDDSKKQTKFELELLYYLFDDSCLLAMNQDDGNGNALRIVENYLKL